MSWKVGLQMKTFKLFKQNFLLSVFHLFWLKATVSHSYFPAFAWRENTLTCLCCHASLQLCESASASEIGPRHTILTHQRRMLKWLHTLSLRGMVYTGFKRTGRERKHKQNVLRSFSLQETKGDKGDKIRANANYTDTVNHSKCLLLLRSGC